MNIFGINMIYYILGKQISPSAVSRAKYELGLPNKYRGSRPRWSQTYWIKVVEFLANEFKIKRSILRNAKIRRGCYHLKWGKPMMPKRNKVKGKVLVKLSKL